jgi:hypothetical protein
MPLKVTRVKYSAAIGVCAAAMLVALTGAGIISSNDIGVLKTPGGN